MALTDLSANANAGLVLAEHVARRLHARITVGYVHTRLDLLRDFTDDEGNTQRLREWVRSEDLEHLSRVTQKHIDRLRLAGTETVECPSAREGVGLLLERVRPDLVCMATHGRTGLKSVLLGSVAEHTIRTAAVPVMVTKAASVPFQGPIRVMLTLDLAEPPEPLVRRIARMLGADDELILVHVVESAFLTLASYGAEFTLPQPDLAAMEKAARDRLARIRVPSGPKLSCEIRAGRPADALLALEVELSPHLIVARTHGRRGFDHLMLGSVSERLARRCQRPVLVYPKLD